MSLINQMLKDLESRRASGDLAQRAVGGMGAAARRKQKKQNALLLGLVVLIAVLASISVYLLWQERQVTVAQQVAATATTMPPLQQVKPGRVESQNVPVAKKPAVQETESVPLVNKSTANLSAIRETPAGITTPELEEEDGSTVQMDVEKPPTQPKSSASSSQIKKRMRPQSDEQLAEQHYQRGYTLLQRGDRKGAEDAWREALRIDAKHSTSRESLAILYLSQSRRIEAADQLQMGLSTDPGNGKLALLYARIQVDAEDTVGAIATLENAMRAKPQATDFYAFTAAVYQRQGDYEKSIAAYQTALRQQSNQSVWWMGLGISLEGAGKTKEALTAYQQAIKSAHLTLKLKQYVEGRIKALE